MATKTRPMALLGLSQPNKKTDRSSEDGFGADQRQRSQRANDEDS